MRIALVHPYSWPNTRRGGERYLHDLGWYLRSAGHDVTIFSGYGGADLSGAELVEGVEVRRAWPRPGRRLRRLPALIVDRVEGRRIARAIDGRWDVVHTFWPTAARAVARDHATLYTLLGMPTAASDPGLIAHLGRGAAAANVAAALSTPAREAATALMAGRWTVLPAGIRTERFPLAPPPAGPPKLLFSASLGVRFKGLPVVLRAFAEVLRHRPDIELVLSGSGSPAWALDELVGADRARVAANLRTPGTGTLEQAEALYAEASVMVLPSRHEALGLSVLEALSTGCPVVVADDGGPREIVAGRGVGAVVRHDDAHAIADACLHWIDQSTRETVRRGCHARARSYDWKAAIGPLHEEVYRAIRDGRREVPSWSPCR